MPVLQRRDVSTRSTFFRPFPDPRRILSERCRDLLLPVGVVAYKKFDPRFDHAVLIALPVEPECDYLGSGRSEYHTDSCRENWLGYSLKRNGLWDVDCDLRFFEKHASKASGSDYLDHYYAAIHARFARAKSFFKTHGCLEHDLHLPPDGSRLALMSLGGRTPCGQNWDAYDETLERIDKGTDEEDVLMRNKAGHRYQYVGTVKEYLFKDCGDSAHFFYEPRSKNVRMVVDYS
jgi:hypothetical protein